MKKMYPHDITIMDHHKGICMNDKDDNISGFQKFKDKWGLGWVFIGFLFFSPQMSKYYEAQGTIGQSIQILGFIFVVILYFVLRQKILLKVETSWIRSVISGIISYGAYWMLIFILGKTLMLMPPAVAKSGQSIRSEMEKLNGYMKVFVVKNDSVWASYEPEPVLREEAKVNIEILKIAIPMQQEKDSVVANTFQNILNMISLSEDQESKKIGSKLQKLEELARMMWTANQNALIAAYNYNQALITSNKNINHYHKKSLTAQSIQDSLINQYGYLYKELFNRDVSGDFEKYLKKYNSN